MCHVSVMSSEGSTQGTYSVLRVLCVMFLLRPVKGVSGFPEGFKTKSQNDS